MKTLLTKTILATLVAFMLAGCLEGQLDEDLQPYVQAGVLLAIEQSEEITAEGVLDAIAQIKATVNLDGVISPDELIKAAYQAFNIEQQPQSVQVVIIPLLLKISQVLKRQERVEIGKVSLTAQQILAWAEEAATLARKEPAP